LFRIKGRVKGDRNWIVFADGLPYTENEFTINDLVYGLTYEIQVEAFNDAGSAEGCDIYEFTFTPVLCPNQPKNLRAGGDVDRCGASSFTLEWDRPEDNIGKPLRSYTVWYRDLCDDDSEYQVLASNIRSESQLISKPRVNDGEVGDTFRYYVEAVNSDCPSRPSEGFDFEFIELA